MSRVIVIGRDNGRYDLSAAEEFGEIIRIVPDNSAFAGQDYCHEVADALTRLEYSPGKDWIALTGPMLDVTMLMATVFGLYGSASLLLFSAGSGRYRRRIINADTLGSFSQ